MWIRSSGHSQNIYQSHAFSRLYAVAGAVASSVGAAVQCTCCYFGLFGYSDCTANVAALCEQRCQHFHSRRILWFIAVTKSTWTEPERTTFNHQRSTVTRCNNSQQSRPSQHHHRDAPDVYRLERRIDKNITTENCLYNNFYPQQVLIEANYSEFLKCFSPALHPSAECSITHYLP